ncbi:hypothetical protein CRYUN_Cryun14cG0018100 [Craigia yunnanensis]
MTKRKISNSESEESESEDKLSEEEEINPKQKQQGISEYEKQRLSRIAENRARMEALGVLVYYTINGHTPCLEPCSYSLALYSFDFLFLQVKNKGSKTKKAPIQKHLSSSDYVVDDDDELMKAIALSLQDSREVSGAVHTDMQDVTFTERKGNARLKRKKMFTSWVQMTEDEMVVHFFQFDGAGKGSISMRDLRRGAIAHDFMWTDKELSDMIHCSDSDGDGKVQFTYKRSVELLASASINQYGKFKILHDITLALE